jgi:transcription initiation factor TFIID subunit 10
MQPLAAGGSQLPPSTQLTQTKEGSSSLADATNQQATINGPANLVPSADADADLGGDPIDDTVDNDIDMNTAEDMPAVNGTADVTGPAAPENPVAALPSASAPTKKESSLRDFLGRMDEYAPIVRLIFKISLVLNLSLSFSYSSHTMQYL